MVAAVADYYVADGQLPASRRPSRGSPSRVPTIRGCVVTTDRFSRLPPGGYRRACSTHDAHGTLARRTRPRHRSLDRSPAVGRRNVSPTPRVGQYSIAAGDVGADRRPGSRSSRHPECQRTPSADPTDRARPRPPSVLRRYVPRSARHRCPGARGPSHGGPRPRHTYKKKNHPKDDDSRCRFARH